MQAGVNVTFRALEKSIRVLEKSWKSPGNLFLKKVTNPVIKSYFMRSFFFVSVYSAAMKC